MCVPGRGREYTAGVESTQRKGSGLGYKDTSLVIRISFSYNAFVTQFAPRDISVKKTMINENNSSFKKDDEPYLTM